MWGTTITKGYETGPGRGLPVGNLTSQHFANFFLAPLDRFIKELLRRKAYVRYMDDFVVWGDDARDLTYVLDQVGRFLGANLKLQVKPNVTLNRIFQCLFVASSVVTRV